MLNTNNIYLNLKSNIRFNTAFCSRKKQTDTFVSTTKLTEKEILAIKKEMNKYPQDIQYRKRLLVEMGVNPSEFYKLRSIIGAQELSEVVEKFNNYKIAYMPGNRPNYSKDVADSHDLTNVQSGDFRANLHIHSVNSDGKMTIQEILDNANEYAQFLKKIKNKPFYIALTDHNTINGCKEAIEIIRRNPKKYENLRVILGCEFSLKMDSIDGYLFKKPQTVHLLAMGLNPYDQKLNDFLQELTDSKNDPMNPKKYLFEDALKILSKQKYCSFALAHPAWPYLIKNLENPDSYLEVARRYIRTFAQRASEKALYVETYYQSYDGEISKDKRLLKTISDEVRNQGLLNAGGIDTHGYRIFYSDSKD